MKNGVGVIYYERWKPDGVYALDNDRQHGRERSSMFYKIIQKKRDEWLASADCPVNGLLQYMSSAGFMRDAQIDAIKTYLYLKIVGQNRSLVALVNSGFFNTLKLFKLRTI